MTDHADLTARLRANAKSLARRGLDPMGSAVVSSARLRDAATACNEAADALDAADAENARLTAERDDLLGQRRRLIDGGHQHLRERDEALAEVAQLRDPNRLKVVICDALIAVNAMAPEYPPIIPPTSIDWLGDALVRAVLAVSEEATDA